MLSVMFFINSYQGLTLIFDSCVKRFLLGTRYGTKESVCSYERERFCFWSNLFLLAFDPAAIYLDDYKRELLKWMETVDVCADKATTGSSRPPMPTLPKQSFISKKQRAKNSSESTAASVPRSAANKAKPKVLNEVKVKQEKGMPNTVQSSRKYYVPSQLLKILKSVDTKPVNEHVTNAKLALKSGAYPSHMYSAVANLQSLEPALFSQDTHHFSQHLDEHLHPVVSYWYSLSETPPDGNYLWHTISLDLCGSTKLMSILRLVTVFTLVENEDYFRDLIEQNEHSNLDFDQQVAVALHFGAWGGEVHLHALSIALQRPIYIYTTFLTPDGIPV